ncbi:MAG: [protein-PII] uridylyltransferase [Zoogloeaceae bacterium]|jgi:[protein-PII] uridylyltransferase|nr:[protein-PII] uridylyltransferase [Zoogloeaceae bacterium]
MEPLALARSLRGKLKAGRTRLADAYQARPNAAQYLKGHVRLVDGVLMELWQSLALPPELALVAVGGYGRGELYPGSDVDVLLLLPEAPDDMLTAQLEQLVGIFWDIGLEVGHSVRTIPECVRVAADDITIQTALLEKRLLTGNAALFRELARQLSENLHPQTFIKAKQLEQEERYHRYQESPYSLEPHCKESPGGLRDLQNILWIAQAKGEGHNWQTLKQDGLISPGGCTALQKCERYLQHLRIRLHLIARRREDRLLFDYQEMLAEALGIVASGDKRASEVLMQAYYRNAKLVTQLNTLLLQRFTDTQTSLPLPLQPLNARFQIVGDFLDLTSEDVFKKTPGALLESFSLMQQHPKLRGMTARTLRALWRNRDRINPAFRKDPENRRLFLSLLQSPQGVIHEFRRMNQFGILELYLPAFGKIVGQMQHDLFHVYTVDQHTLMVMRNLRRFALEEFAHEYPYCTRLHNAFARPWVLYVAALFHDIAKGRGGDHSLLGMEDAREFCLTHAVDAQDMELIVWLVGEHLTMSRVAQKEDLTDPSVIAAFAARMWDKRHLTALYLLTVADIRGTSPKVWNNWKASLLEDLYRRDLACLETGDVPEPQGVIQERQAEALRLLRYFALSETVHERLWRQLDTVYFLRHTAEEIAWHTRALHYRIQIDKPVVTARLHQVDGLQVMVYTRDQPDLFLRLAGFFARMGYSIADAKIHTTRHGYALDSFILLNVAHADDDREMLTILEVELARMLEEGIPVEAPAAGRLSRLERHFPITPEVHIRADEREASQQVLSLVATDRPGLLFYIARVLAQHHINLKTARIGTLGKRVEDTFLISGPGLDKTATRLKLESELLQVLQVENIPCHTPKSGLPTPFAANSQNSM